MEHLANDNSDEAAANSAIRNLDESLKDANMLDLVNAGTRLLDAGCGFGYHLRKLLKRHPLIDAYGIDISGLCACKSAVLAPKAKIIKADIQALPFPDELFDIVFMSNELDLCLNPLCGSDKIDADRAISEAYRVIRKGGAYFVFDINLSHRGLDRKFRNLVELFEQKDKYLFVKR